MIDYINTENLEPLKVKDRIKNELINNFLRLNFISFEYDNLPNGITGFNIEKNLFYNGITGLIKQENSIEEMYYNLRLTGNQETDFNGEIVKADLTGYKTNSSILFNSVKDNQNAIFIKNSINNSPVISMIYPYIEKLVKIWFSDINNLLLSNKKLLAKGKPEEYNSVINEQIYKLIPSPILFMDIDKSGYEKWESQTIENDILDYKIDYEPLKYSQHYRDTYMQVLNLLGVEHNSSQKKERNVISEVEFDMTETSLLGEELLYFRQEAIERFNKLYGLDASVKRRKIKVKMKEEQEEQEEKNKGDGNE